MTNILLFGCVLWVWANLGFAADVFYELFHEVRESPALQVLQFFPALSSAGCHSESKLSQTLQHEQRLSTASLQCCLVLDEEFVI